MSFFWFDFLRDIAPNHLVTEDVSDYPAACKPYEPHLKGRSMLVKKAAPLPVECIVRGYLSGSGWKDYKKNGSVCGIELPDGLLESQELPSAIFTPSTKAAVGVHDENISFDGMIDLVGRQLAEKVRDMALGLYSKASAYARGCGVIIADTKFEFGLSSGELILIDEVLTPDSSRFWLASSYRERFEAGLEPESRDKEFVRLFYAERGYRGDGEIPKLDDSVWIRTSLLYQELYEKLTGLPFVPASYPAAPRVLRALETARTEGVKS